MQSKEGGCLLALLLAAFPCMGKDVCREAGRCAARDPVLNPAWAVSAQDTNVGFYMYTHTGIYMHILLQWLIASSHW